MTFERRKQGQENMAAGRINELCERENDCFSALWLITSISLLFLLFFSPQQRHRRLWFPKPFNLSTASETESKHLGAHPLAMPCAGRQCCVARAAGCKQQTAAEQHLQGQESLGMGAGLGPPGIASPTQCFGRTRAREAELRV